MVTQGRETLPLGNCHTYSILTHRDNVTLGSIHPNKKPEKRSKTGAEGMPKALKTRSILLKGLRLKHLLEDKLAG